VAFTTDAAVGYLWMGVVFVHVCIR